jgi:hypothetical protein
LLANGYPLKFLNRILDETCATFGSTASLRNVLSVSSLKFMSIPYIPSLFEKFKRLFQKYDVKVVGKGENNVRKKFFSSLKDTDVTDVQSGVVYQVPCLGCAQVRILGIQFSMSKEEWVITGLKLLIRILIIVL